MGLGNSDGMHNHVVHSELSQVQVCTEASHHNIVTAGLFLFQRRLSTLFSALQSIFSVYSFVRIVLNASYYSMFGKLLKSAVYSASRDRLYVMPTQHTPICDPLDGTQCVQIQPKNDVRHFNTCSSSSHGRGNGCTAARLSVRPRLCTPSFATTGMSGDAGHHYIWWQWGRYDTITEQCCLCCGPSNWWLDVPSLSESP